MHWLRRILLRLIGPLITADLWLISQLFTPIVSLVGRKSGMTTGGIVRQCSHMIIAVAVCEIVEFFQINFFTLVIALMYAPFVIVLHMHAKSADRWPNTNYVSLFSARMAALSICFFNYLHVIDTPRLGPILWAMGWSAWTAGLYFASCPPAPPKEEFIKGRALPQSA